MAIGHCYAVTAPQGRIMSRLMQKSKHMLEEDNYIESKKYENKKFLYYNR